MDTHDCSWHVARWLVTQTGGLGGRWERSKKQTNQERGIWNASCRGGRVGGGGAEEKIVSFFRSFQRKIIAGQRCTFLLTMVQHPAYAWGERCGVAMLGRTTNCCNRFTDGGKVDLMAEPIGSRRP